jgi:opacity protein-like surface antigen
MRRITLIFLLLFLSLSVVTCVAQQEYVGQYDAYFGFAYLTTPNMNLAQRGWQAQFGYNYRRWLALGFDTSYFGGNSSITLPQLNNATLAKLAPILPLLPPGYTVWAPYHANTYTITGGPQFNYRHFKYVTLFIHPDIGAMHQSINVHPQDLIMTGIVTGLLGPSMKISQWSGFYGVGGGVDLNVSKHVAIRLQSDWVYTTLFQDLLRNPQYTWRMSASPTFRFGKNVPK